MEDHENEGPTIEFYRRSQDECSRLYSRPELERQVREGLIAPDELVQLEGAPIWQPVRIVVGALEPMVEEAVPPVGEDDLPTWPVLLEALALRFLREFENPTPAAVAVFLAIGGLGMLGSRLGWWLWLPWFLLVLVTSVLLIRRGRVFAGIPFALGALLIPYFLLPHGSRPPEAALALAETPPPAATPPRVIVHPHAAPLLTETATPVPPAATPAAAPLATPAPASTPAPAVVAAVPAPVSAPVPAALAPVASVPAPDTSLATPAAPPDVYRSGALVIIRDDHSAGSGFLAEMGGKRYLFTNVHVAAGMKRPVFTLLDGSHLTPTGIEAAVSEDIMRFTIKESPEQFMDIATGVDQNARIDDDVTVFGNSGGGGVVTSLPGKVVGIGPDRIEVSSAFIPGNSGSPIIHMPTGRVLGVATYLTMRHEEFAQNDANGRVVRRFGFRLDSVKTWEPVSWQIFQADADRVEKISVLTEDIYNFLEALQKKQPLTFATDTLGKPAQEWRATLNRRQLSMPDRRNATQSFLSSLRFMVRSDVVAAENTLHYSYFKEKLQKERVARDELYKAFDTEISRMAGTALQAP